MPGFLEKIKLYLFRSFGKSYKKRLFRGTEHSLELNLVSFLLKEEKLFLIDVGANRGEFIHTAEKTLPENKIWAFEPLPYFALKLKALFPGITVFNNALSDKEMQTTLYVPVNKGVPDDSLSSVIKPATGNFQSYDISCTTLDLQVEKNKLEDNVFLKIDVEGHEFSVLAGAEKTLKKTLAMLIEIEERHHKEKTLNEMINEVEKKDFVCYYLHPGKACLVRFSEHPEIFQKTEDLNTPRYINNFWFFAKQSGLDSVITGLNQSIA